ncbi:MAG: trypsin-like serine protease [Proteobacteria bacterium]|nr:MAG: trypsin-like serine protease [Pseudomonadota bacterium]
MPLRITHKRSGTYMGNANRNCLLGIALAICSFAVACTPYIANNDFDPNDAGIMGGTEIRNEDPLSKVVALLYNTKTTEICTASILNNQFVLTAAHCVANAEPSELKLIFDTAQRKASPTRAVTDFRVHDSYVRNKDEEKNAADIAVVRFAGGVPKGFRSVRFLPSRDLLKTDTLVTAVGYGTDDDQLPHGTGTLRTTVLPILNSKFSQTELTLDQRKRIGVCHGDSGGPIFLTLDGQYYLWGVTSRSTNLKNCSEGSIITNALMFNVWIYDTNVEMGRQKNAVPSIK